MRANHPSCCCSHSSLLFVVVLVQVVSLFPVSHSLPFLSPAVFTASQLQGSGAHSRTNRQLQLKQLHYNPAAINSLDEQLGGSGSIQTARNNHFVSSPRPLAPVPISEDEGYILAEKMVVWLQKFMEKLMILRGLRAQLLPPHQKYPVVVKAAATSPLRSPAYSDLAAADSAARDLDDDSEDAALLDYPQNIAFYPTNGLDEYGGLKPTKDGNTVDLIEDDIDDNLAADSDTQTIELGGQNRADMKRGGVATADTRVQRRRSKRNPRCLHMCLKRGYLHPAQCHSLC
eukprot:TRINITY_DN25084_c0_g1_i1.p1 TRINITY_DN25084_c0_g1~~TRINITY_DN25084_c0_g1_i1.p1  ORF type:complete len:287 (-),score=53.56 TRINITY_DN25084_c0_g1_i1:26-886(-)